METIINALLELFSAHNFGVCTNASSYATEKRQTQAHAYNVLYFMMN